MVIYVMVDCRRVIVKNPRFKGVFFALSTFDSSNSKKCFF
jgi:hypothetical protein